MEEIDAAGYYGVASCRGQSSVKYALFKRKVNRVSPSLLAPPFQEVLLCVLLMLKGHSSIAACLQASQITNENIWIEEAWSAFRWFLGENDLQVPLYDATTGGCRDGLHPDRVNENQGAESTLSFLMALLDIQKMARPVIDNLQQEMSFVL